MAPQPAVMSRATPCRWLLLAGDSNTRFLLETLAAVLQRQFSYRQVDAWPHQGLTGARLWRHLDPIGQQCQRKRLICGSCTACSTSVGPHCVRNGTTCRIGCMTKFFDQERIFIDASGTQCLAISFRFMMRQGELLRVLPPPPDVGSAPLGALQATANPSATRAAWPAPRVCEHSAYSPNNSDPDTFWNCEQHLDWSGEEQSSCCDRWRRFDYGACMHSPLSVLNAGRAIDPSAAAPMAPQFTYPARPDFAWLSHGFWATASGLTGMAHLMPRGIAADDRSAANEQSVGASRAGLRCAARFASELLAIDRLRCAATLKHTMSRSIPHVLRVEASTPYDPSLSSVIPRGATPSEYHLRHPLHI